MQISGPLKWHGAKTYLWKWHQSLFPQKGTYTSRIHAYAGGLNEFWNLDFEGIAEIVNDLNKDLTNFWKVLQDRDEFEYFRHRISSVPFSQIEWEQARDVRGQYWHDPVEHAVAFFIHYRQSRQGLGKDFATLTKTRTRRGMQEQVSAWLSAVEGLPEAHQRLKRVLILNEPAVDVIRRQDAPEAFFYLDPPYVHDERVTTEDYEHEMTAEQHDELLGVLVEAKGKVLLCNYPNAQYNQLVEHFGWKRYDKEIDNKSSGQKIKPKKIESVYLNYEPTP